MPITSGLEPKRFRAVDGKERAEIQNPAHIISRMGLRRNDTITEICSGTGFLTIPISKFLTFGRVHAVEPDPSMLNSLRTKIYTYNIHNIILVELDPTNTEIESGIIDHVIISHGFYGLKDPSRLIIEILRILKPQGHLTVLEFKKDSTCSFAPPVAERLDEHDVLRLPSRYFRPVRIVRDVHYYQVLFCR
jgi:ubiquinone/menaquinone biosynthesis C-methylase UbiE